MASTGPGDKEYLTLYKVHPTFTYQGYDVKQPLRSGFVTVSNEKHILSSLLCPHDLFHALSHTFLVFLSFVLSLQWCHGDQAGPQNL